MFTRVTRSKSGVKATITSPSLAGHTANSKKGAGARTLTSSFKVSKDAVARKSTSAKAIITEARSTASVKRTTRTTSASSFSKASAAVAAVATPVSAPILPTAGNLSPKPIPSSSSTTSSGAEATTVLSPQELLAKGLLHLRTVSPALARWIDNEDYSHILTGHLRKPGDPPPNYFRSLARGIISQQVSGAAAASILKKFISLFYTPTRAAPDPPADFFPTPTQVLNRSVSELRSAGLSERKTQYMHSLATEFINNPSLSELHTLSNEEIIEKLTRVKGIGVWSVEMLLIFTLGRWDVFSIGDLGIQRGMAVWDGRDVNKLKRRSADNAVKKVAAKWKYMSEADMKRLSEQFSPWRSLFCLVMWKASDAVVDAIKEGADRKGKKGKGRKQKEEVVEEVDEDVGMEMVSAAES